MQTVSNNLDQILDPRTTRNQVGMSRTTLWRLERAGQFPRHIQISSRKIGWLASDIQKWLEAKKSASVKAVQG